MNEHPPTSIDRRMTWLVFWVSAAVLVFEIGLMRLLLVASWHHFASLVISIVLLGFGASGTVLTLARPVVMRRPRLVLEGLALLTGAAMPLAVVVAMRVPLEARLAPAVLWTQVGRWVLCWAVLAVPVTCGAAAIALALMIARGRVAATYAANLIGSGAGAIAAPLLMLVVPPAWLPAAAGLAAWIGAAPAGGRAAPGRLVAWGLAVAVPIGVVGMSPPHVRPDPFKYSAFLRRLEAQGAAQRVARSIGPRAQLEAWSGSTLHDLPFLGVGAAPPPLSVITVDGHWAGSVLEARAAAEAAAVDHTLMSAAYALVPPGPRVALLGEIGGANVWTALRRGAIQVDVIQPHARLVAMLRGPLAGRGGTVLDQAGVRCIVADPRHALRRGSDRYDLVHVVTLEGSAAGSGGLAGLSEDHLFTVEGMLAAMGRLTDDGLLMVCRGIQTPPRDNVRILLTLVEALRRLGVAVPERHVVVVRDYLAVCTLVKRTPWSPAQVARVRALCAAQPLTPVWFPGVRPDELNRPDALEGPAGGPGDWYHEAARRAFAAPSTAEAAASYRFDVRPPTDDRPFFHDFCRLSSVAALREAYGDLWLTRAELAFPLVLASAASLAVAGALLTLLPLAVSRGLRRAARGAVRGGAVAYFTAIGLGYLMLEIVCLSRLARLIGDPVTAAAAVIAAFLLCSGVGSLLAQRLVVVRRPGPIWLWSIVLLGSVTLLLTRALPEHAGHLPLLARLAVGLLAVAPIAVLMGIPMPVGLDGLSRGAPAALPWAWGINGFASVTAAPLATVLGMAWGYTAAGLAALACYSVAALTLRSIDPTGSAAPRKSATR